jgi:hypothetical protein
MYAMQYEITLPADYEMGIIRRRVQVKGHVLDDFPGLGLKAYLIRDQADGSTVNQYAAFYLWNDPEAMGRFLWGGGLFTNICTAFGRPPVRHWTGVDSRPGPDRDLPVVAATKHVELLAPEVDPAESVPAAVELLEKTAVNPGVHSGRGGRPDQLGACAFHALERRSSGRRTGHALSGAAFIHTWKGRSVFPLTSRLSSLHDVLEPASLTHLPPS